MIYKLGKIYARVAGRPYAVRFNRALMQLGGRGLGMLNYENMEVSGEAPFLARTLGARTRPMVFDVGANRGDWTSLVRRAAPSAVIHAFEPNPHNADHLRSSQPGVFVSQVAVTSAPGQLEMYDYAEAVDRPGSGHATALPGVIEGIHGGRAVTTLVAATTLDAYCTERGITQLDFLKIDVEGLEYDVLLGATQLLADAAISVIQFEFNEMNLVSHRTLRDFEQLLGTRYTLARLLPSGHLIDLSAEIPWLREQFVFQNIVATRHG